MFNWLFMFFVYTIYVVFVFLVWMKKSESPSHIYTSTFSSMGIYCPASTDGTKKFLAALFNHPKKWYYVQIGMSRNGRIKKDNTRLLQPGDTFLDNLGCLMKVVSEEEIELIDTKTGEEIGRNRYKSYKYNKGKTKEMS